MAMKGRTVGEGSGEAWEVVLYVCLEEGSNGMVMYQGGTKYCVWVNESMPALSVMRKDYVEVKEIMPVL